MSVPWRIWRDRERTLRFALGSGGDCVTLNGFGVGVFSYAICPAACEHLGHGDGVGFGGGEFGGAWLAAHAFDRHGPGWTELARVAREVA